MDGAERNALDSLLNLLADEVAKRLEARWPPKDVAPEPPDVVPSDPITLPASETTSAPTVELAPEPELELQSEPESVPAFAAPPASPTAPLIARLALGVLVAVALINVPLNAQGLALARSIPSSASLVIRNGLVVKEATSEDIWVFHDGAFHWISSMEAFEHLGYRWQDVHIVEPGFLSQFEKGRPLYLLLKCDGSPHIYRLEAGGKRWIVDIPTFEAEGHVWQDVKSVTCDYLRNLPDGDSIPPGRGSPPPPLP